jgi:hypothetical protein
MFSIIAIKASEIFSFPFVFGGGAKGGWREREREGFRDANMED